MSFAPEGRPFIAAAVVPVVLVWIAVLWRGESSPALVGVAVVLTLLAIFVAYFFRVPSRATPDAPDVVLAPADGRIVDIAEVDEPTFLGGRCRRISIFLSIFNVHVQVSPVTGQVTHRNYRPGGYAVAWKPKASEDNEQASLGIEMPRGRILVRQIAGLVARRIVTDPELGDPVVRGRRIGLIRFGSRVDTFLPLGWPLACAVGETARGGLTVLARWNEDRGTNGGSEWHEGTGNEWLDETETTRRPERIETP